MFDHGLVPPTPLSRYLSRASYTRLAEDRAEQGRQQMQEHISDDSGHETRHLIEGGSAMAPHGELVQPAAEPGSWICRRRMANPDSSSAVR